MTPWARIKKLEELVKILYEGFDYECMKDEVVIDVERKMRELGFHE